MFYSKVRFLTGKLVKHFLRKFTSTITGSFLFYHIVLKSRFGIFRIESLIGNNLKYLARNSINLLASWELRKLSAKAKSLEEIIELSYTFQSSLPDAPIFFINNVRLYTFQNKFEITEFLKLLIVIEPKIILEIGTAMGGTLYLLSRFSASRATLISIDLPQAKVGDMALPTNPSFFKNIVQKKQRVALIRDDSHKFSTFQKIKKILKNGKIDVLFIDGDHTYEGVKKDFEMYKSLVKSGGLICFHDIVPGSEDRVGHVPDFWSRIRENYNSLEIVKNWNQGGFGIGIIFVT